MSNGLLLLGVHSGFFYDAGGGGGGPSYTLTKYRFFNDDGPLPNTPSTVPVEVSSVNQLASGSNTASTVWFVSTQGVSTNDLVIWHIGWDDSTTVSAVTASTAPNGQAISSLMGPVASQNTEVRSQVYWVIATTSWAASTTTFTPSASETRTAIVWRIPAGQFNSSNPFGSKSTYNANASTSASVSSPSFTATTSDAVGRLIAFNVIDVDPITGTPAGWQSTNALDLGNVTHGISYRTSTVGASESIPSYNWTIAGDSSVTHAYILNGYATTVSRSAVTSESSTGALSVDTDYGVHARVENTVSSGVSTFKWQYLHSEGTSTWTDITDSSAVVKAVTTSYYAHGDDVLEYLTGSGAYITNNNAGLTSSGAWSLGAVMEATSSFESHLNFQIVSGDVSNADNILLRIALGDGTELNTYTVTPDIDVVESGGVAHSGETNQTVTFSGASGFTISNQTSAGSNRMGICHMGGFLGASGSTAVTWGGTSMVATVVAAGGDAALFHLVAPATGASSVVCTGLSGAQGGASASTYTGADQSAGSGPIADTDDQTATAASPATNTLTAASGEMCVDAIGVEPNATPIVAGANQVQIANVNNGGVMHGSSYQLGADGGTMTWTYAAGSWYWDYVSAVIKAA